MRDADSAEPDRQPVAVGLFAGLADRHHDAAPIGGHFAVRSPRSLSHQRRVRDGQRDALGARSFSAPSTTISRICARLRRP